MQKNFLTLLLGFALLAFSSLPSQAAGTAYVRFINLMPGSKPLMVNGAPSGAFPAYGTIGDYAAVPGGKLMLKLGQVIQAFDITPGRSYTIYTVNGGNKLVIHDDWSPTPGGSSAISKTETTLRIYNLSELPYFEIKPEEQGSRFKTIEYNGVKSTAISQVMRAPGHDKLGIYMENKKIAELPTLPRESSSIYSILIAGNESNPVVYIAQTGDPVQR